MRGYAGLGGVCHAGGGERGDRASEEEGVPASDSTRRRSGQERPQPGIGGRSRHDASRSTSSASRGVTCDLLSLSLSLSLCVCAPVCVSIACGAPACLSGCDFQVQCAASSWWDYDRRSRYHKVVHLAMHGTSAK